MISRAFFSFIALMSLALLPFGAMASIHSADQTIGGFVGLASTKARVSGGGMSVSSSSDTNFIIGASYERGLDFHENLVLQLDPTFAKKGSGGPSFIEVPVLAKYKFNDEIMERTYVSALGGLSPAFKLSSGNAGDDVSAFHLGLEFGGELEHHLQDNDYILFFGARYNLGLTDVYSSDTALEEFDFDVKFSSIKLMAGARIAF